MEESNGLTYPDYPRDMVGYGANPPKVTWPGKAKLALQFVINYEEGGENCILHGDPASEAFLSEVMGASPWQGQRHMSIETIYEYGSRVGFWRLHRLFTEMGIPVTVFGWRWPCSATRRRFKPCWMRIGKSPVTVTAGLTTRRSIRKWNAVIFVKRWKFTPP